MLNWKEPGVAGTGLSESQVHVLGDPGLLLRPSSMLRVLPAAGCPGCLGAGQECGSKARTAAGCSAATAAMSAFERALWE